MSRTGKSGQENPPKVFDGTIASGDRVIKAAKGKSVLPKKNSTMRWKLGLMDKFFRLVVLEICDYSNGQKKKRIGDDMAALPPRRREFSESLVLADVQKIENVCLYVGQK